MLLLQSDVITLIVLFQMITQWFLVFLISDSQQSICQHEDRYITKYLSKKKKQIWIVNSNLYLLVYILIPIFVYWYLCYVSMYSISKRVNNQDDLSAIRCDHTDIIQILVLTLYLLLQQYTAGGISSYLSIHSFINIGHIMSKHTDSTDGKLTTLSELLPIPLPLPMMARSNSRNTLQALYTHAEIPPPPPLHHNHHHDHNQKDKVELSSVLSPYDYIVLEKILPFIEGRDMSSKSIIEMACLVKTSEADLVRLVTKMPMQLQIVKKLAV